MGKMSIADKRSTAHKKAVEYWTAPAHVMYALSNNIVDVDKDDFPEEISSIVVLTMANHFKIIYKIPSWLRKSDGVVKKLDVLQNTPGYFGKADYEAE